MTPSGNLADTATGAAAPVNVRVNTILH